MGREGSRVDRSWVEGIAGGCDSEEVMAGI